MAETLGLITTAGLEQEAHARTGCAAAMVSEPTAKNFSIRSSIGTHPCADMKFANERSSAAACRPRSRGLRPPARGPERGLDALRSARRAGRGAAVAPSADPPAGDFARQHRRGGQARAWRDRLPATA